MGGKDKGNGRFPIVFLLWFSIMQREFVYAIHKFLKVHILRISFQLFSKILIIRGCGTFERR